MEPTPLTPTKYPLCCDTRVDLSEYEEYTYMDKEFLEEINIKLFDWANKYFGLYEDSKFLKAKEYFEKSPFILPDIFNDWVNNKNKWIIYDAEIQTGINPYVLEYVAKSIGLNFTAESFFGSEFLEELEKLFGANGKFPDAYKSKDYRKTPYCPGRQIPPDDPLYDIDKRQYLLRYQVHWVTTGDPGLQILFCTVPINHYQAQFLINYYLAYLQVYITYTKTSSLRVFYNEVNIGELIGNSNYFI